MEKEKNFNCFLKVKACPLSLDSRRSCRGIEFQDVGPVTTKARRCVVAERQKGRRAPSGANRLKNAVLVPSLPTRRYNGPAPTTLFQTRQHILKVRRSGTGNQCKVSMRGLNHPRSEREVIKITKFDDFISEFRVRVSKEQMRPVNDAVTSQSVNHHEAYSASFF